MNPLLFLGLFITGLTLWLADSYKSKRKRLRKIFDLILLLHVPFAVEFILNSLLYQAMTWVVTLEYVNSTIDNSIRSAVITYSNINGFALAIGYSLLVYYIVIYTNKGKEKVKT